MSPSEYTSMSFCKESNKLVGTNNFLAWKKRTVLIFGSIGRALAMKIGGEAKAHEICKTQKSF